MQGRRSLCVLLLWLAAGSAAADAPPAGALQQLLDRPRVAPDPQITETRNGEEAVGGSKVAFTAERLTIASEKKRNGAVERVPMLIVRPTGAARRPAVIVLHGTGGSKEGKREQETMLRLAARGITAVAIDARYHGARGGGSKGADAYNAAILAAWRAKGSEQEHPFYYDTVWDLWRTIDYLQTRRDIDPQRLGMIGFSMGGIETWLASAADPRIKVVVPAIGVQSFRWSLEHDRWQGRANTIKLAHDAAAKDLGEPAVNARVCRALWSKVIPGILDQFDGPSLLPLIAPRPLLVLSGELDPNCPLGGAKVAFAAAEKAYRGAAAGDHLKILVAPATGHKVTDEQRQAAVDWFVTWLKP